MRGCCHDVSQSLPFVGIFLAFASIEPCGYILSELGRCALPLATVPLLMGQKHLCGPQVIPPFGLSVSEQIVALVSGVSATRPTQLVRDRAQSMVPLGQDAVVYVWPVA